MDQEIQELIQAAEGGPDSDTSSDVALARMLQMQYDKEHNEMLKAQEKKYNGTNKGEWLIIVHLRGVLYRYIYSSYCSKIPLLRPVFASPK